MEFSCLLLFNLLIVNIKNEILEVNIFRKSGDK